MLGYVSDGFVATETRLSRLLVAMMVAAATAVSAADPPPKPDTSTTVSGVEVTAPRRGPPPPMQPIRNFVGSVSVMSTGEQLAIWHKSAIPGSVGQSVLGPLPGAASGETICPVVFGLPADYAAFIVARIRQVGEQTGAPVAKHECAKSDGNVIIAFPTDAVNFIHELADKIPDAFGFVYHGSLERDLNKPIKPIRAWYATDVIDVDSRASRLSPQYISLIEHVLIIVDTSQTDALNMGQLSDYIAMTALAEIKPGSTPPDAPSILNVFSDAAAGRAGAAGLTPLDLAYLKALYAIGPRQAGVLQKDQIADRIRRALAGH